MTCCIAFALLAHSAGPRTEAVQLSKYHVVHYVSSATGSDRNGDGTALRPWATLTRALARITGAHAAGPHAVLVASGMYKGDTLQMKPYVDLYGGYDAKNWQRDLHRHASRLDGESARRIIAGADHARIDGFTMQRGRVRGHGGAILCDGVSPVISNNTFLDNGTLAPENWKPAQPHETAHDGGAIAVLNGAAPRINNNLFARNTTESGRGAAIACNHRASPVIAANVMIQNRAGLRDPARSSDGGAVSVYDRSDPEIVDNIIAANTALGSNDGGGIFAALWSSPRIAGNLLVGNSSTDDAGGIFVGGQKHHYGTPLDPAPALEKFLVRITGNVIMGNENPSHNSGAARITMQARALLEHNIIAFNPGGLYIQSSAAELRDNVVIDDVLLINDSKASQELPGPVILANNVVLGKLVRKMEATVVPRENAGVSMADGWKGSLKVLRRDPARYVTVLVSPGPVAIEGRAIRVGSSWTAIKETRRGEIVVWGLVPGETAAVEIVPSYHVHQ